MFVKAHDLPHSQLTPLTNTDTHHPIFHLSPFNLFLQFLVRFLQRLSTQSQANKMDLHSLAIVMTLNLFQLGIPDSVADSQVNPVLLLLDSLCTHTHTTHMYTYSLLPLSFLLLPSPPLPPLQAPMLRGMLSISHPTTHPLPVRMGREGVASSDGKPRKVGC